MTRRFAGSVLAVTLLLSGCMTLFADKNQDVTFTCNVPGAKIHVEEPARHFETDVAPGTVSLPRLDMATWSVTAPGYVERSGKLTTKNNGWFTGLVVEGVLTLGVGMILDIALCPNPSVPILDYAPTTIPIDLVKIQDPPLAPAQPVPSPVRAPPSSSEGSATLGVKLDQEGGEGRGVLVTSVTAGSLAERGGIEVGDLIARFDGKPTPDVKSLHQAVASASRKVPVAVLRRGRQLDLYVSLPEPAVTTTAQKVETTTTTGDTYVLAIGVNDYQDARIPKLHFAEQDARAVYGFFATSRKSPTAQDRVMLVAGKDATRNGILRAIREHLERKATRAEDTIVFYFGGHGFSDADDTYLAGCDTQIDSLPETGLSSATLREYWSKIRAGRKVLIMDACHAGGIEGTRGTRGVGGVKVGDESTSAQGTAATTTLVIAATGPNELSTEDTNLGHGVFTRVLLNGLSGEADDDKDGHVTGDELGSYLVREVPGVARSFGGNQTPVVTRNGGAPSIVLTR
jgi:hypothetical protein